MQESQEGEANGPQSYMMAEEQEALGRILHALLTYGVAAEADVSRWERNIHKLSQQQKALIPSQEPKFAALREAIIQNQLFLRSIALAFQEPNLTEGALKAVERRLNGGVRTQPADVEKARYVLKNAMRDWSVEGADERRQSYGRILDELTKRKPLNESGVRVLVPGCGLGRLPYDLASMGYETEGNEYSYYMLLASSFMINETSQAGEWSIQPWIHTNCNQLSNPDQLRVVPVPDVSPSNAPGEGLLSMSAGDFVDVYSRPAYKCSFDCVTTCFFLDCAHNIIDLIEVTHSILKEGGVWINLGPLTYHWADAHTYLPGEELSIELSLEDVLVVIERTGFTMLDRKSVQTTFNANTRSMAQLSYSSAFWTAEKSKRELSQRPSS